MSAADHYKAGRLQEAIDAQIQLVKAAPGDPHKRVFLFDLLAFTGDLERIRRQIDAVQFADVETDARVATYRKLLDAEDFRRKVFRDGIMPRFLAPPPEHLGKRLEAINALRNKQPAEAVRLIAEADAAAPPVKGMLNSKPFVGLRDLDDLFGPTLEVMAHGDYYWVPLEQVEGISMGQPRYPRDLVWFPAKLGVREGPAGDVFLPNLYAGSHENADDQLRLGRLTDWSEGAPVRGVGARLFLVGEQDIPLLEWRSLQLV